MKRINITNHDNRVWDDMRLAWERAGILRMDKSSYFNTVNGLDELEEIKWDYDADILSITGGPSYSTDVAMSQSMIIFPEKIILL